MGSIKINGGLDIARLTLNNAEFTDDYKTMVSDLGFDDVQWDNTSVVVANMNKSAAGNGADYQFQGIDRFIVYKTIGKDNPKLYKVAETKTVSEGEEMEKLAEDYIVGDMCSYQYYVYPICVSEIDGVTLETVGNVITSEPITLNEGVISVMSLVEVDSDKNIYTVDKNNIWNLYLNLNDGGITLNTNKTFSDTHNRYQQETGTYRAYKSKNIIALLGNINNAGEEYSDTYEKLEAWDDFCRSSDLKAVVDLRGRILIGDIDNNPTTEYGKSIMRQATVSFSFKELNSIDNVTILGDTYAVESDGVG